MRNITWRLKCDISSRLDSRLVQEGIRLHFLADRAWITGVFDETESQTLDNAFPHFIRQMEAMLTIGELAPRHVH